MHYGNNNRGASGSFNRAGNGSGPRWKQVSCGDVVWLPLPQTLSTAADLCHRTEKTRPFLILQKKTNLRVDTNDCCLEDVNLIGVDTTSQETLIEKRPHVPYHIPGSPKDSFALLDSVRTVPAKGERIRVAYSFKPEERALLAEGLDTVLKPEQRFFLRSLFNSKKGALPGQIWTIELPTGHTNPPTREADAMVLLRRGRFYLDENEAGQTRFTPYLAMVFPDRFKAGEVRGLRWEDMSLVSIHERSFLYQVGQLTDETVGIMLNTLRSRAGLQPIEYQQPLVRHIMARLSHALFMPTLLPRGFR